jgi:hypothetical protein
MIVAVGMTATTFASVELEKKLEKRMHGTITVLVEIKAEWMPWKWSIRKWRRWCLVESEATVVATVGTFLAISVFSRTSFERSTCIELHGTPLWRTFYCHSC